MSPVQSHPSTLDSAKTSARTSARTSVKFELVLTCIFATLCFIGILHHEMWRDELQAWNIARDSTSIGNLFQNMRTEGHPALWHLCLYAITRVTRNPLAMQLFQATVATANVYLLVTFSPFTQRQKVLASFGYFNFYEYALISRGYVLGVFLLFSFCSLYARSQQRDSSQPQKGWLLFLLPFLTLGLLANTSVYGLFLSVALSVALVWPYGISLYNQRLHKQPRNRPLSDPPSDKHGLKTLAGIGILGLGWLACYLQVSRIHVFSYTSPGLVSNALVESRVSSLINLGNRLMETLSQVWLGYVPLPPLWWQQHFWSTNALADLYSLPFGLRLLLPFGLSLLLMALVIKALHHQPKWLAVYAVGTALPMLFGYFIFPGYLRHHGHLYLLLLACFWLSSTEPVKARSHQLKKHLLTGILTVQMLSGVVFYIADINQDFSGSQAAADFLRSRNLTHLTILGYSYSEVSTLSGYLDTPIYYPEAGEYGTFWRSQEDFTEQQLETAVLAFLAAEQQPVVIALHVPLEIIIPGVSIQPLTTAYSKIFGGGSIYLYMASRL